MSATRLASIELLLAAALASGAAQAQAGAARADQAQAGMACAVSDPDLQRWYRGGCRDGRAEGHGEALGESGAYYIGEFHNGAEQGKGTKLYPNGDAYTGDWQGDRRSGRGTYVYGNASPWRGDSYTGGWQDDRMQGRGVYSYGPDDARLPAQFDGGTPHGVAPPSIVQRQRTLDALAPMVGRPGAKVCSISTVGASPQRLAHGTVLQVQDDRILVRIAEDDIARAGEGALNPRWEILTLWSPC